MPHGGQDTQGGVKIPQGILTPEGQAAHGGQDKLLHRHFLFRRYSHVIVKMLKNIRLIKYPKYMVSDLLGFLNGNLRFYYFKLYCQDDILILFLYRSKKLLIPVSTSIMLCEKQE